MNAVTTVGLIAALMLLSACGEQQTAKAELPMQVSVLKWDELAAAGSAAHVTNNNLIMMR